jgi:hypothetical protein
MTPESSEPDEEETAFLREMDRIVDAFDDEPTHEKWRRGAKWR